MNIASLDRASLIASTQALVAQEKRIDLELLEHVREIDRRMLHLEMGYPSLFEFAVKFLGLSEASAYRRIAAMRLMREVPEIKEQIASGSISMSNVAAVQTFFRAEKKQGKKRTIEEKKDVLRQVEGLSKRECERKLLEIAPQTAPRERERTVTPELTELKLLLDAEMMAMIEELKARLSHALPHASTGELLKHAIKELLHRSRDARTPKFAPVKVQASAAETRRQIFSRAGERCEFVAHDGKRCESKHDLEIDHVLPRALGGTDAPENLRVLCRAHNGYEAVRVLGRHKMQAYLPGLAPTEPSVDQNDSRRLRSHSFRIN